MFSISTFYVVGSVIVKFKKKIYMSTFCIYAYAEFRKFLHFVYASMQSAEISTFPYFVL